ncbi:MAG: TrpR-like protein, YerC/YecD [Clostridia bacterium]|nr:TrpR-like protein, YerC/YecD [Clostridia bacterium]
MENFNDQGYELLIQALISLETREECAAFLEDLMTRKEMDDISQRLLVVKMLSEQAVYNKIVEETGASTATISRVNRAYVYGTGGYAKVLEKLKGENK